MTNANLETITITEFNTTIDIVSTVNVFATLETISITTFNPVIDIPLDITTTIEALTITTFNTSTFVGQLNLLKYQGVKADFQPETYCARILS